MKLIVIGLDGAGFELIDPWIEKGALPNIAKIRREGVWADMRSVFPPVTAPNWKCYSTGKNPGKIGIFWWENVDWPSRRVYYPVNRIYKQKEIWDYMGDSGLKVGVVGMPTTYPPKKVNGFLISGGESEENNFTYPKELEGELKNQGWRNKPRTIIEIDTEEVVKELHEIIDIQFKLTEVLADRYSLDFLQATCFDINILQHFLWDTPETRVGWEIIDKHIGKLMEWGCDLIIMSDHGSNKIKHVFNINTWLEKEGYLKLNLGLTNFLSGLGINRRRLMAILSKFGIFELARRIVPKSLQWQIPDTSGEIPTEIKTSKVDWQRSKAVASGQGPIYLNPENHDNEALKKQIKHKLEALIEPVTGDKITRGVYTREEIYHGKYLAEAPDIMVSLAKGIHIPGSIGQRNIFDPPQRWQAENKDVGLFMAYGPNVNRGRKIDNVSILDLAPTILHMMNVAIPDDMDGSVLKQIFRPASEAAKREIVHQQGGDKMGRERERIKQAIKKLKT